MQNKIRNPKNKIQMFIMVAMILFLGGILLSDQLEEAKGLASNGDYKKAYEKLLIVIEELQTEVKNLQGLVEYYKCSIKNIENPPYAVDYAYNESANRLWASAWSLQHEGVFKKTGREREECLQRAIDTYKRIVIDYPYSNKAEEAQYRIGRLYYKFVKDYSLAEVELQRYLDIYPKGRFAGEVRELLERIKR